MYLMINGVRHTVTQRVVSQDTIKYLGVDPAPSAVSGAIRMYRNDGFLLSSDDSTKFSRKLISGNLVQMTNRPAPNTASFVPAPEAPSVSVSSAVVG